MSITTASCVAKGLDCGELKTFFEPDADVAGLGVIIAFAAVTFSACVLSALYWLLQVYFEIVPRSSDRPGRRQRRDAYQAAFAERLSWFEIIENVIISFSDQQLFVGVAWGIALQFLGGCETTAYHYNIITHMLIMTCATHLVAIAVVRKYWKSPAAAVPRVLVSLAVYVLTGMCFINQQAAFPSSFDRNDPPDNRFIQYAVCYQTGNTTVENLITNSAANPNAVIFESVSGSTVIANWNLYVILLVCYAIALLRLVVFGLASCIRSRPNPPRRSPQTSLKILRSFDAFLQLFMLAVGFVVSAFAYRYIVDLREYLSKFDRESDTEPNDEAGFDGYGQLIPLMLMLLTTFQIIGDLSVKFYEWKSRPEEKVQAVKTELGGHHSGR
ncbi:uncharacterized protein K489DRAFT_384977 [Dissoconium aciculare CBS 342.82]|uniref:Uncharacterized protein n=1 Tax=Dissoconium aciculare CBS 342.82 TaxID=1314786 RepID=A0A6J3LUS4_9PEZI|nr:uncharacterized protein K489DRAFT_384977 [Dissoconium aciculare CBS 342.82]KAF1818367.1 hypothetical protein K489DRAFT_384977 [Dissoconium aciculare CBS 342.82]